MELMGREPPPAQTYGLGLLAAASSSSDFQLIPDPGGYVQGLLCRALQDQ